MFCQIDGNSITNLSVLRIHTTMEHIRVVECLDPCVFSHG